MLVVFLLITVKDYIHKKPTIHKIKIKITHKKIYKINFKKDNGQKWKVYKLFNQRRKRIYKKLKKKIIKKNKKNKKLSKKILIKLLMIISYKMSLIVLKLFLQL